MSERILFQYHCKRIGFLPSRAAGTPDGNGSGVSFSRCNFRQSFFYEVFEVARFTKEVRLVGRNDINEMNQFVSLTLRGKEIIAVVGVRVEIEMTQTRSQP